jgi:hypothetical protein
MPETILDKLKLLSAWETEPVLTETEVEAILDSAAIADAEGNSPTNDNWQPTYDINRAAAEAWLIKAARASALTEIDPPESGIVTSKVFDNCISMAKIYSAKPRTTLALHQVQAQNE